ncbi:hypothetical protein T265_01340 [Opisthorchis viverrini]|uniref:Uncharacterized protein n=1 Tax=Opisthorchis viverrini TaxID=6198 RepID=A0A075A029_OPIVI|nr:hypothetical protein T265_01340 [Opisthorchis viverrini]KER32656.1 hypothetical protein T265_01340 [Opisthorchis viverrini]
MDQNPDSEQANHDITEQQPQSSAEETVAERSLVYLYPMDTEVVDSGGVERCRKEDPRSTGYVVSTSMLLNSGMNPTDFVTEDDLLEHLAERFLCKYSIHFEFNRDSQGCAALDCKLGITSRGDTVGVLNFEEKMSQ